MKTRHYILIATAMTAAASGGCGNSPSPYWAQLDRPSADTAPPVAGIAVRSPYRPTATQPDGAKPTTQPDPRVEQFDAAYGRIVKGQYGPAADELARLADRVRAPDPLGPRVLFWLGWCRQELKEPEAAREAYQRLLADWPGSPYAGRAAELLEELQ